jgi:hypothetical protein
VRSATVPELPWIDLSRDTEYGDSGAAAPGPLVTGSKGPSGSGSRVCVASTIAAYRWNEVRKMLQSRRAAQVLALAILAWLVGTIVMVAWIAALVVGAAPSHQVDETMVLVLVLGPQAFISAVGIAALLSMRRDGAWAAFLGRMWASLETVFALLAAGRILVLASRIVTEGWTASWDSADVALVFRHGGVIESTYWTDIASVAMLVVAVVGAVAAFRLAGPPEVKGPAEVRGAAGMPGTRT